MQQPRDHDGSYTILDEPLIYLLDDCLSSQYLDFFGAFSLWWEAGFVPKGK